MSRVSITKSKLDTLAATISAKSEVALPLTLDQMNTAVANIEKGITPTGTLNIYDDGTYDVTNYASADINYNIYNHLRYITFVNNTSKRLTLYTLYKTQSNNRIAYQTVILQSQATTYQYIPQATSIFEVRSTISDGNYSMSYTNSSSSGSVKLVAEKAYSTTIWIKIFECSALFSMTDGVITFTDSSDPFPEEVITEPLSVISNGTYTAPSGTAYTPVTVAVPNTYEASDEGKVVSSGALVAQSSDTVTQNDTYDTTLINSLTVNVPTPAPSLQTKSISPSETAQTVTPDSGYDGLSQVSVGAISNTYVGSGIDRNDSTDLTASGATVTVPAGYYENSATKAITSGTEGTPTATKGTVSSHSITITPSVTNTAGYISGGTHTGTGVTVQASELVSGTYSVDSSGTKDVTNYASVSVPSGTAGTPSAAKGTVSNNSITVTPSVTNVTGYITGGTKTGTGVAVSASELVSGTYTVNSSGTKDVTNYASISVSAGTAGTPSATKGTVSNHQISVTPSVTNTTGWITGSTKSGTAVTVSASELVSGSETKTSNGTYDVTNLASLQVAIPIVTYYTGSSAPSSSLGQNGDIYLQTS